ncbi:MAG: NADH-quinone oxidoreductase subunit J, partial [Gammaproteobacteria bacterium]|nr:NADH-quinone oxidoreductase subunit J [Gammaproteobacteria bacterium]
MMNITEIIFYLFAMVTIGSGVMVIASRNPVQGALFLVMAFVAAAGMWMMMEAEFLSLVLILVYVGAVMTLFLFVVMMLNVEHLPGHGSFKRYLPFAIVMVVLLVAIIAYAISPPHFALATVRPEHHGIHYSNTAALGQVLYTHYVYAFELAAVILLASII